MKIKDVRKYSNVAYSGRDFSELEKEFARGETSMLDGTDGPFSLASVVANEARILRNASGIPLYVYPLGDEVVVANTIRDIQDSLEDFDYNNMRVVPSSHIITVTEEGTRLQRYRAELPDKDLDVTLEEIAHSLREKLEAAIGYMVKQDRQKKAAVLLSGGIDSSAVATLLQEHREGVVGYTLDFGGKDLRNAEFVAKQLGLPLRKVPIDRDELDALLKTFILSAEEYRPFVVDTVPGFWFLGRAAQRDGIEVVYTGSAANELFGDYSPSADYNVTLEENAKRTQRRTLIQGRNPKDPLYNQVLGSGLDRYGFIKPLMDFEIETREPWGALNVLRFGIQIPYKILIERDNGKIRHRKPDIARIAFPEIGIYPEKERMGDGSGISRTFTTDYRKNRKIFEEHFGVETRRHNQYISALNERETC